MAVFAGSLVAAFLCVLLLDGLLVAADQNHDGHKVEKRHLLHRKGGIVEGPIHEVSKSLLLAGALAHGLAKAAKEHAGAGAGGGGLNGAGSASGSGQFSGGISGSGSGSIRGGGSGSGGNGGGAGNGAGNIGGSGGATFGAKGNWAGSGSIGGQAQKGDASRLALVSPTFRSAASSDAVWKRFLPCDYQEIISKSTLKFSSLISLSKKDLFFHLCHHPVILNNGTLSFSLDKWTGKKCYMLGARELSIMWKDTHTYWRWTSRPESRFSEVAELKVVCWLDIRGKIDTKILSTKTTYAAYLVFKFAETRHGFTQSPVIVNVKFEEFEGGVTSSVPRGALRYA
ncbi:Phloem protein 2-like protein [Corchorus olitorius]|uniref:Phloem protein 2-like protein n=1 Tax=Corchorus olitorius TaxID=93759 RepID=A0A1R3J0G4_9ROSI|nr:Phloem protein 2-like protein [Corchorus olitorius]